MPPLISVNGRLHPRAFLQITGPRNQGWEQGAAMRARGGRPLLIGIWLLDRLRGMQHRKGGTCDAATKCHQWRRYP
jgi:hypothetical protein